MIKKKLCYFVPKFSIYILCFPLKTSLKPIHCLFFVKIIFLIVNKTPQFKANVAYI